MFCGNAISRFTEYLAQHEYNKSTYHLVVSDPQVLPSFDNRKFFVPVGFDYHTMVAFDLFQKQWIVSWCDCFGQVIHTSEIPNAWSMIPNDGNAYERILEKILCHPKNKNQSVYSPIAITAVAEYLEQNIDAYQIVMGNPRGTNGTYLDDNRRYFVPVSMNYFTLVGLDRRQNKWIVSWCDCYGNVLPTSKNMPNPCDILMNNDDAYELIMKKIKSHPNN